MVDGLLGGIHVKNLIKHEGDIFAFADDELFVVDTVNRFGFVLEFFGIEGAESTVDFDIGRL